MGLTLKQHNLHLSRRRTEPQLSVMLLHNARAMKENSLNSSEQFLDYRILSGLQQTSKESFCTTIHRGKRDKRLKENLTEVIIFPEDFFQNEAHFAAVCFHSVYSSTYMDGETCCKNPRPQEYIYPHVLKPIHLLPQQSLKSQLIG